MKPDVDNLLPLSPATLHVLLALTAGLALVNTHNEWTADWRVAITLLGWLCVVIGIIRLVFVGSIGAFAGSVLAIVSNGWIVGEGIVILAFGAWLSFKGYAPDNARTRRKR